MSVTPVPVVVESQVQELIARNDGGVNWVTGATIQPHSYRQLADIIEGRFPA